MADDEIPKAKYRHASKLLERAAFTRELTKLAKKYNGSNPRWEADRLAEVEAYEAGAKALMVPGVDDAVCEHGTAMDVHCCNCHTGFIFDMDHECPEPENGACHHGVSSNVHCSLCEAEWEQGPDEA